MNRDQAAGSFTLALGILYAVYASWSLPLGSLARMGPGMFPLGLGVLMAFIGLGILFPALAQDVERPRLPLRSLVFPLAAVAAFALVIRPFGMIPAISATVVLGSFAMPRPGPGTIVLLTIALAFLTWAIFIFLLQLPIPLWAWPF